MSDRLEQELAALFHERADQLPDAVEAPDGLTARVRRRVRRRRQSALASLTVVAVAAGLASVALLRDDESDRVRVQPAGTTTPPTAVNEEIDPALIDYFAPVSAASVRNGWVVRDAWAREKRRRVSACLEEQGFPPLGEYVGDTTSWWYFPDEETLRSVGFRQSVPAAENFGTPLPTGDDYRQALDECGAQALPPEPGRSASARMEDWHTDVVEPAVARPEEQELWSAAAACLRARGYADEWLDAEENFVGQVGGSVMRIADNDARLARELEIAGDYIECAKPVWMARTAWLVEQRKTWVDKHHGDLVTVQRALDEYLAAAVASSTPTVPAAEGNWTPLADAPIAARARAASTWTGTEMIVWGGGGADRFVFDDGAAYDPAAGTWRTITDAPIEGREAPATVWTGQELLVWGGRSGGNPDPVVEVDGAAYDPAGDSWRTIPEAPIAVEWEPWAVWTGEEMIVGGSGAEPGFNAAAYDPAADSWRTLELPADAPADGGWSQPVWTGDELMFWVVDWSSEVPAPARGYALDPANDAWRTMAQLPADSPPPDVGDFSPLLWTGTEVLGRGTYAAWAYDPATDTYRPLPTVLCGGGDAVAWTGTRLLSWGGSGSEADEYNDDGFVLDPSTGGYEALPVAGLDGRRDAAAAWTGDALLVWGGEGEVLRAEVYELRYFAGGAAYRP